MRVRAGVSTKGCVDLKSIGVVWVDQSSIMKSPQVQELLMKLSNGLMTFDERDGDDDGIGRPVTSPGYCATFAPTPLSSSPISVNG